MSDYDHKEFPKTVDPKDFWGQVKRSVNGQPVSQEQIDLIVETVCNGLLLNKTDTLLDIGCGNGALSVLFFNKIKGFIGFDFSEYLISVAKENFEKQPGYIFNLGDAYELIKTYKEKTGVTKALCYGAFQYFDFDKAKKILYHLNYEYENLVRIYIGNLPDKERAEKFFYKHIDYKNLLDNPQSSIGIWRSMEEMKKLANDCGWEIEFLQMPDNFYAAHYRYDVLLKK